MHIILGKALSAQHYANWDQIEASTPTRDASTTEAHSLVGESRRH
jgi:hypothetical protein